MNNDPFYLQIIERLGKKLDPDVFEQCMADLLRNSYPGLVPVPGGKDAGMDGAIGDGKGEPMPLIVTTQESVITKFNKKPKFSFKNQAVPKSGSACNISNSELHNEGKTCSIELQSLVLLWSTSMTGMMWPIVCIIVLNGAKNYSI